MSTKIVVDESKRNNFLRIFIKKFPKSDLAIQVRCIGLSFIKTDGGFAGAVYKGEIKNAIDSILDMKKGDKKKLQSIGENVLFDFFTETNNNNMKVFID